MNWALLKIAAKNLLRNKRRTAVVAVSVAMGVTVSIIILGIRQSAYDRMILSGAKGSYGLLTVSSPNFITDPLPKLKIKIPEGSSLVRRHHLEAYPRISTPTMVQTANGSVGAQLFGIDFMKEDSNTNLGILGLKNPNIAQHAAQKATIIGDVMAQKLGASIGTPLILSLADKKGDISTAITEITDIFHTGSPEFDAHVILTSLSNAQSFMGYEGNEASLLALYPPSNHDMSEIARTLTQSVGAEQYEISTWQKSLPELSQTIAIDRSMHHLLCGFAAIITGVGILNAMLLSVIERRREFGVILALGMTPRELLGLVCFEAFIMGILGLGLGALMASPLYYYLATKGFDLTPYLSNEDTRGVDFVDQVLGCRVTFTQLIVVSIFLVIVTILASIIPALKAAKTEPIAAIGGRS